MDYGGKISVLWVKYVGGQENEIWCAEISLGKRNEHVIYGNVEWSDVVLTIPKTFYFLKVVSSCFFYCLKQNAYNVVLLQ